MAYLSSRPSKSPRSCAAGGSTPIAGDGLPTFGSSFVPGAGRPPRAAGAASGAPRRPQQPPVAALTEKSPWPGLAQALETALPRPLPLAPAHVPAEGLPLGGFGNLASARRFVRGSALPPGTEDLSSVVPQRPRALQHGHTSHTSSASTLGSPQFTLGGSSSSSSLLPGTVTHPPDPRWLRHELSAASVLIGRHTAQRRREPPLAEGGGEDGDALRGVDLTGVEPGQADFVRGLFGSCLPRPPERQTELDKQERERKQLARAEKLGARVAQRILKRRTVVRQSTEGLLGPDQPSRVASLDLAEAVTEEAAPPTLSPHGSGGTDSPQHRAKSPPAAVTGERRQRPKPSGLMGLLRLRKDRGSRLVKVDRLRRSFWKCSTGVARTASDSSSSPKGRPARSIEQPTQERTSSIGSEHPGQRRRALEPTGDPRVDALQAAFKRYNPEGTGALDFAEARAAIWDVGLQPSPKERRDMLELIDEAIGDSESRDGIHFGEFEALIPRIREVALESRREDLQEWYTKGLDSHGEYSVESVKACLEALGAKVVSSSEWLEVKKIFAGFAEAAAGLTGRRRLTPNGQALLNRISDQRVLGESTGDVQFELFEVLYHQAQEALVAARRAGERKLGEELQLSEAHFEEFREDLVELHALFEEHDGRGQKVLRPEEVMNLLVAFGCVEARSWLTTETLLGMMRKAKEFAVRRNSGSGSGPSGAVKASVSTRQISEMSVYTTDPAGESKERLTVIDEAGEGASEEVFADFNELLYIIHLVRRSSRESRRPRLLSVFGRYDYDRSGLVATKDISKLLCDIKVQPRTREEQLEMRRLVDDADENGEGALAFPQFELLMQSVAEHMECMSRHEEERYALELGLARPRFRRLYQLFEGNVVQGTRLLSVEGLRQIMTSLHRRYTPDDLHALFEAFSRQDLGGIDLKAFLRMMHAIEIAKTHGQSKH